MQPFLSFYNDMDKVSWMDYFHDAVMYMAACKVFYTGVTVHRTQVVSDVSKGDSGHDALPDQRGSRALPAARVV